MLKRTMWAVPALAAMLLAGCGGSGGTTQGTKLAPGVAVGEQNPSTPAPAVVLDDFVKMAQAQGCSEMQNRLFVIDNKQVYWERMGNCPDYSYARVLFGATTKEVLCSVADSIAGPMTSCPDASARELFDTIQKNRDLPDLGLAASGRKVEMFTVNPAAGNGAAFETILRAQFSGVAKPRNVVVKDHESFMQLWNEHNSNGRESWPLPLVDFTRRMVVAVFGGDLVSGCQGMAISKVSPADGKLVVEYEILSPETGMVCPAVVTQPVQMVVVERSDAPVEFVMVKATGMFATQIDQVKLSGVSIARDVVIKDQPAWEALWAEHAGKDSKAPAIDFGTRMVVAVFLGFGDGCSSTTISTVSRSGGKITVRHDDTVPGPATLCMKNITAPAHIVAIDRSDLPVVFVKEIKRI